MTEPIQNRSWNRFQHRDGTRSGTTDQTQTQTQTVVKGSCGVCGSSFHPSHGELGQPRATHPTAVPGAWMELR